MGKLGGRGKRLKLPALDTPATISALESLLKLLHPTRLRDSIAPESLLKLLHPTRLESEAETY